MKLKKVTSAKVGAGSGGKTQLNSIGGGCSSVNDIGGGSSNSEVKGF